MVSRGWPAGGQGDINADPLFARIPGSDYHSKSEFGRWDANTGTWLIDDITSPCINMGNPNDPVAAEPLPNGNRINLGAYGGTTIASKSFYIPTEYCRESIAGDLTGDCRVDSADHAVIAATINAVHAKPARDGSGNDQTGFPDPWDTIGSWQIGG